MHKVGILCRRDTANEPEEAVFCFAAVLLDHSMMPFTKEKQSVYLMRCRYVKSDFHA